MSVLVTGLIDHALVKLGDPSARRYKRPTMLQLFNEVQHWFATELKCFENDYYFNLEANEGAYAYPINRVQVKKVRVTRNATPTGIGDYYPLDEMFENEFAVATSLNRPPGDISHYFARVGWYELVNTPNADIIDGGLITVSRVPVKIEAETNAVMELPDFCEMGVQEGMFIEASNINRDAIVAEARRREWRDRMVSLTGSITDPAADRRASVRPPVRPRRGWR